MTAIAAVREAVRTTTFVECDAPELFGLANLVLAAETFQHTGSFKFRAAYSLAKGVSAKRLIAASSGNFGQALSYACRLLGKTCTIVMPSDSASVKIEAVRRHGGVADLVDVRVKPRQMRVKELADQDPEALVVSAYDDPLVIEGNSTLGEELAESAHSFDAVFVPVGGGGLCSGILQGLQRRGARKDVFACEPLMANDFARSFKKGEIVRNEEEPKTIADGARTLSVGKHNWEILMRGVKDVLEVPEETIEEALRLLFLVFNVKAEPTGALTLAALLAHRDRFKGRKGMCIISGGNVDPAVYCKIWAQGAL